MNLDPTRYNVVALYDDVSVPVAEADTLMDALDKIDSVRKSAPLPISEIRIVFPNRPSEARIA